MNRFKVISNSQAKSLGISTSGKWIIWDNFFGEWTLSKPTKREATKLADEWNEEELKPKSVQYGYLTLIYGGAA